MHTHTHTHTHTHNILIADCDNSQLSSRVHAVELSANDESLLIAVERLMRTCVPKYKSASIKLLARDKAQSREQLSGPVSRVLFI